MLVQAANIMPMLLMPLDVLRASAGSTSRLQASNGAWQERQYVTLAASAHL